MIKLAAYPLPTFPVTKAIYLLHWEIARIRENVGAASSWNAHVYMQLLFSLLPVCCSCGNRAQRFQLYHCNSFRKKEENVRLHNQRSRFHVYMEWHGKKTIWLNALHANHKSRPRHQFLGSQQQQIPADMTPNHHVTRERNLKWLHD